MPAVDLPEIVSTSDPNYVVMTKEGHAHLVDSKDSEIEQLTA